MSEAAALASHAEYPIDRIRADFVALDQQVRDRQLVYLDSAATALKPRAVIDAVESIYGRDCANVHRGVHVLSQRATKAFEAARDKCTTFINAPSSKGVIFTRGTTEGINMVAQCWARTKLGSGDEILVSGLEHHSNIVPWQMVCEQTGATLVVAEIADDGDVPLDVIASKMSERTRVVAMAHISNALGTVLPIAKVAELAHARGAVLVVDGAQAVPHVAVDVQALGCDFYAFSGHKLYGPTGIGVLWGKEELLDAMPPYQGGGDMIRTVSFKKTTYAGLPSKFEAGTPNIAGAVGLGAAVDYVSGFGFDQLEAHEQAILAYGTEQLQTVPGLNLIGTAPSKMAVLSFTMDQAHPHDIGTIVDMEGGAIRTGHHCAQPVMTRFKIPATARASLGMYNSRADIDALVQALLQVRKVFPL